MKLEELAERFNNGDAEPELLRDLSNLLSRQGNHESSNTVLSFLCRKEPSIQNIILYSASLIESTDRSSVIKGINLLNEILDNIKLAPEYSFEVRKLLGNAYTKLGDIKTARVFYENCLKIDGNSDIIYSNLGIMAYQDGDYEKAEFFFEKSLELNGENTGALTGCAMVLIESNRYDEAYQKLDGALSLEPDNIVALNACINLSFKTGRLPNVLPYIEKYLHGDPLNSDIVYTYAVILYQLGRFMHASLELEKILVADPDYYYAKELKQIMEISDTRQNRTEVV
ncbi:MAG: tetratricopeptide repeat protein [Oligoflexia bacterium]|nr:tetratricopeptide repeat protein [Oligoflexia bacterium]